MIDLKSTENLLKSTWKGAASLLFPYRCAGCDYLDINGLCDKCFNALEWIDPDRCCVKCCEPASPGLLSGTGVCPRCRKHAPSFKRAVSALRYSGPIARAVVLWKYENYRHLSDYLAKLLNGWISTSAPEWFESINLVVPVPLHPETVKKRGFSPPEELASRICRSFSLSYAPRLVYKIIQTLPQARLNMAERIQNVSDSMMVFDESLAAGKMVLVVDDVMTTGATMSECSRALIKSGAACVYGLTLARQYGLTHGKRRFSSD